MTRPLPPLVAERLRALRERPAEPTDKGFGYPVLTLRESALEGNLAAMADWCAGAGVELAPHGKTAMSPELAARQLDGAHLVIRADFDYRDSLLRQFPGTFSVPARFTKHMMIVADIARGEAGAIEDALEAAWQLQRSAD